MKHQTERKAEPRGLEDCRVALSKHFATHHTIPSMAGLARLWGYASKSSASRRVDQMLAAGIMHWSADRRLTPGAAFFLTEEEVPAQDEAMVDHAKGPDPLPAALDVWAHDYDPAIARSYSVTTRLLRLARRMELHISRSSATEGLTSGDLLLLDALYRVGPPHRIAPTALKHYFLMSLAGVAKRVDRLESLGFIDRVPNPEDRRGLFIQLTKAGRQALARLVEADRAAPQIVWPAALSEVQYQVLLEALTIAEEVASQALD